MLAIYIKRPKIPAAGSPIPVGTLLFKIPVGTLLFKILQIDLDKYMVLARPDINPMTSLKTN